MFYSRLIVNNGPEDQFEVQMMIMHSVLIIAYFSGLYIPAATQKLRGTCILGEIKPKRIFVVIGTSL